MTKMKWVASISLLMVFAAYFILVPSTNETHSNRNSSAAQQNDLESSDEVRLEEKSIVNPQPFTETPKRPVQSVIDPVLLKHLAKDELAKGIPLSEIEEAVSELDEEALAYLRLEALQSMVVDRLNTIASGGKDQINEAERDSLVKDIQTLQDRGAILGTEAKMMIQYVRNSGK